MMHAAGTSVPLGASDRGTASALDRHIQGGRMNKRISRLSAVVALLAATALVATGCGGGGASEQSGSGGGAKVFKIGIGAPLTAGSVAQGQGIERGVKLALKQASESAEAKELGITFESVSGDDQGDPKTGVTVANTFASDPSLLGVVGHLNSGVTIPASKVYNDAKLPVISPAATNPALTTQGFNNVFRTCTIDSVQGPAGADAMFGDKVGAKTAVVVDDSTPYGEGLCDEFAKKFEELGGTVAFREKTSDKDTDFNALATKTKAANPDVVYYGGTYNAGSLLSKQMSGSGIVAPLMGGDGLFDPEFINLAGAEGAEGDMCTSVGLPTSELPKGQEFEAAYKAEFPDNEIGAYDAYSYDAADVLVKAIFKVGKEMGVDKLSTPAGRDAIIAAVAATDMEGVTGQVKFDQNGDTLNKAITVYRVESGEWKPFIIPQQ
ncbi:MAG: branched-chain amino acid ABC transporter substrate-binding protein [Actinobacteria bacterium]|nr:MAG: branched-chain amino acid ABC transporter substrate-binding protein [Actinomycetota bacterium]